jgi:hypothetical protein
MLIVGSVMGVSIAEALSRRRVGRVVALEGPLSALALATSREPTSASNTSIG